IKLSFLNDCSCSINKTQQWYCNYNKLSTIVFHNCQNVEKSLNVKNYYFPKKVSSSILFPSVINSDKNFRNHPSFFFSFSAISFVSLFTVRFSFSSNLASSSSSIVCIPFINKPIPVAYKGLFNLSKSCLFISSVFDRYSLG